jgi:hypothetical protein
VVDASLKIARPDFPKLLGQSGENGRALLARGSQSRGSDSGPANVVENNFLSFGEPLAGRWDFGSDLVRNRRDTVQVAVDQITGVNANSTDGHRNVNRQRMTIPVSTNRSGSECREADLFDLFEIAPGAAGDQAFRAKGLVNRAHHFTECCRDDRIVEVLVNHHGWSGHLRKGLHLLA